MNTNNQIEMEANSNATIASLCMATCRKFLSEIERMKQGLLAEFQDAVQVPTHLLELALNEAEALAMQTGFPQLLFPTLAIEKAQALAAWHRRQQSVIRGGHALAAA